MNVLRVIPAYRRLEAKNKQLTLACNGLNEQNQKLCQERTNLESGNRRLTSELNAIQAILNKPKPRHMVFFHLLRTGGSSTWTALVAAAGRAGLPVCDIYHQARQAYGDNTAIHASMYDFQRFVRNHDCLIHHHIPYCLDPYFDEPICYTTILRDPVDRFVSEVNHVRHIMNGELDSLHEQGRINPSREMLGLGWPQQLLDMAADASVELSKVLLTAADHPHFNRYYCVSFSRLLNEEQSKQAYENSLSHTVSPVTLAEQVRGKFDYIGSFKTFEQSIRNIAGHYGLTDVNTSEWLNKRMSDKILPELRASLKPAFADDYELIQSLGIDV